MSTINELEVVDHTYELTFHIPSDLILVNELPYGLRKDAISLNSNNNNNNRLGDKLVWDCNTFHNGDSRTLSDIEGINNRLQEFWCDFFQMFPLKNYI